METGTMYKNVEKKFILRRTCQIKLSFIFILFFPLFKHLNQLLCMETKLQKLGSSFKTHAMIAKRLPLITLKQARLGVFRRPLGK